MENENTNIHLPAAGMLLISEPFLYDPNFNRTVILLCDHEEEGSVGYILNRLLNVQLKDVLDFEFFLNIPLFLGGPVQNDTLHFIHRDERIAATSRQIGENLYWGGDFGLVKEMLINNELDPENYRFFLGYSGWTQGQLEDEILAKTWITTPATAEIIFEQDNDEMWKSILHNMGGNFRLLSNSPENPQLN
jgi:putative transcriptional regulator